MKLEGYKEKFILLGGLFGIGAISLAITLAVYNVQISKNTDDTKIKDKENMEIALNEGLTKEQKIVAQNLINELEKIESTKKNAGMEEDKNDIVVYYNLKEGSSSISENVDIDNTKLDDLVDENIIETSSKVSGVSFIKPLDGDFGMGFSNENLVYFKTLDEWSTHSGIDILAEAGSEVKAASDGIIRCMYEDVMCGFTIVIEHDYGYVTRYSGILDSDFVEVGQEVKQGEIISKVSEPSGFELDEGSHLHFEVVKDGINIEPKFN